MALQRAKTKLLRIEKHTSSQEVGQLAARLCQWRATVTNSPSLGALLGPFLEYIRATAGATFTDEAVELRARIIALDGASTRQLGAQLITCLDEYVEVVVHGAWAVYRDERRQQSKSKAKPWWRSDGRQGSTAFATDVALVQQRVREQVERLQSTRRIGSSTAQDAVKAAVAANRPFDRAARTVTNRIWTHVERPLLRGRGYVVLAPGRRLALEQLAEAREAGTVRLSGSSIRVLQASRGTGAAAVVAWSTDTLLLPPLGINCVLALLAALLGMSLRALGMGSDPVVRLNPPIVSLADLAAMRERARSAEVTLGAVRLPRVPVRSLCELLQLTSGVYMFTGLLLRGGVFHRHACGFNAGASLFYVNPEVVMVSAADRLWPLLFFDRMALQYGLHVPPLAVRQLAIELSCSGAAQLPCAANIGGMALVAAASASQQRKRTRTRGKIHRGKRLKHTHKHI